MGMIVVVLIGLTGCASRGALGKDGALTPAADTYSRNWIVAGPTLVGNVVCGTLGVPFYLVMGAFAHCERTDDCEREVCNWASQNMGYAPVVPGVACGAVTGAPFIPVAMLAPERPVELRK
jgi:hypothetical protein